MRKFYLRSKSSTDMKDAIIDRALFQQGIAIDLKTDSVGSYMEVEMNWTAPLPFRMRWTNEEEATLFYSTATYGTLPLVKNLRRWGTTTIDVDPVAVSFVHYNQEPQRNPWKDIADKVLSYKQSASVFSGFGFGEKLNSSDMIKARGKFYAYAMALSTNPENPQIKIEDKFEEKDIQVLKHEHFKAHIEEILKAETAFLVERLPSGGIVNSLFNRCIAHMQSAVQIDQLNALPGKTFSQNEEKEK